MRSRLIALLVVAILPLAANAQQSQAPKDVQNETSKDAPKSYVPGLEQFMNVILIEHNKLWFAGKARNWPLAAYELGEIKEVMSDVQDHVPTFKSLPLADMLDAVITKLRLRKRSMQRTSRALLRITTSSPRRAMHVIKALKTALS